MVSHKYRDKPQTPIHGEAFHLSNRLLFRLFKTTNSFHVAGTKWILEINLTTQQCSVLGALARPDFRQGTSVKNLSDFLHVSRKNVNGLLYRLENRQLTQRITDTRDRRTRLVQLTDKGLDTWNELATQLDEFYEESLSKISPEELQKFLYFLEKLQSNLQKM